MFQIKENSNYVKYSELLSSMLLARDCYELLNDSLPLCLKFPGTGETFFMLFFTVLTCLVNLFFPISDDGAQYSAQMVAVTQDKKG